MKLSDMIFFAGPIMDLVGGDPVVDVAEKTIIKAVQNKINKNPRIPYQLKVDGELGEKTYEALDYVRANIAPTRTTGEKADILQELDSIQASARAIRSIINQSAR